MGSIALSGGAIQQQFPVGTSVGAYARVAKNPGGAPVGAAIVAAAVAADSTLTLTHASLTLGGLYTAYALVGSSHRYVDFSLARADVAEKREAQVGIRIVEASVDLASLGAAAAGNTDVPLPAGSCRVGDGVVIVRGDPALNAGYIIQSVSVLSADVVRIRATNAAGTVDPAAASYLFAILKA